MNSMGVRISATFSIESKGCVISRLAPGSLPHFIVASIAPMLVKLDSTIRPANGGWLAGRGSMAMAPPGCGRR